MNLKKRASVGRKAEPVMTRLDAEEIEILDTLVAGGVARSRSDALTWCVRRAQARDGAWLGSLREALKIVEAARAQGPV